MAARDLFVATGRFYITQRYARFPHDRDYDDSEERPDDFETQSELARLCGDLESNTSDDDHVPIGEEHNNSDDHEPAEEEHNDSDDPPPIYQERESADDHETTEEEHDNSDEAARRDSAV